MQRPLAIIVTLVVASAGAARAFAPAVQTARTVALPEGTVLGAGSRPAVSRDGAVGFLAPSLGDTVVAFNVVTGDVVGTLPGHGGASGLSLSESGTRRLLAVTAPNDPRNGVPASVTVVDASAPGRMRALATYSLPAAAELGPGARAEFVGDTNFAAVAVAGPTPAVVTFDIMSGSQAGAAVLDGPVTSLVAVEAGAPRLLGASPSSGSVKVLEVGASGEVLPAAEFALPDGQRLAEHAAVAGSADGRFGFVAASSGELYSFDLATGSLVDRLATGASLGGLAVYHGAERETVAVVTLPTAGGATSVSGAFVAEADLDGRLRAVRTFVMEHADAADATQRAEFSADGASVVIAARTAIYFVDIAGGEARRVPLQREAGQLASAPLAGAVAVVASGTAADVVEILPFEAAVPDSPRPGRPAADGTPAGMRGPAAAHPQIDRLAPTSVERGHGQPLFVTLLGSGFLPGATAVVDGVERPLAVAPGGARAELILQPAAFSAGPRVALEVKNPDGERSASMDIFVVEPKTPVVASVAPGRARAGSVDLEVSGDNFRSGAVVRVRAGGRTVDLRTYRLAYGRIVAELPAGALPSGTAELTVVDRDGVTVSDPARFDVPRAAAARPAPARRAARARSWRRSRHAGTGAADRAALRPRRPART